MEAAHLERVIGHGEKLTMTDTLHDNRGILVIRAEGKIGIGVVRDECELDPAVHRLLVCLVDNAKMSTPGALAHLHQAGIRIEELVLPLIGIALGSMENTATLIPASVAAHRFPRDVRASGQRILATDALALWIGAVVGDVIQINADGRLLLRHVS